MSDARQERAVSLVTAALREVGMDALVWVDEERRMLCIQPVPEERIDDVRRAAQLVNDLLGETVAIEEMCWIS